MIASRDPGLNTVLFIGPIIATFAIVSLWEATHGVRKWNYPFGIWLLLAPWILHYNDSMAIGSDMATGILVILFSSIQGKRTHNFVGGWSSLWKKKSRSCKPVGKSSALVNW